MLSPMQTMQLFSFVYLSAAEALSNSRAEGLEATTFWGRELLLSEKKGQAALTEKRAREKESWEGGGRMKRRKRVEEVVAVAAEEDPARAAIRVGEGLRYEKRRE